MANEKINKNSVENTFRYANETFSGCDMTAAITINMNVYDEKKKTWSVQPYTKVLGELQTVSYSIHMEKKPIRSIGNVNAKDYVMGPRTIAGSLVFSVFNKHFAEDLISALNAGYQAGTAFLVDELPPFDITISAANEYGYRSSLVIYGVRLLNEGQVMSINDVYTENTYQYFATDLQYLTGEMYYVRDKESKMYKLRDNIETHNYPDTLIKGDFSYKWTKEQEENYNRIISRPIILRAITKQPTRFNGNGIVDFSIDPYQDEGTIFITSNNGETNTITIKGNGSNKINHASISLPSNKYTAFYQSSDKRKSNAVKFNINSYYKEDLLYRYAPIIERVTDNEIKIYSNEPTHDMASISIEDNESAIELKNRRGTFINLDPDTSYSIFTYNSKDNMKSKSVYVKTLTTKNKLFEELINYCYANSRLLAFKEINSFYLPLIKEAELIAEKNNKDTTDSLIELKEKYLAKIKALDIKNPNYDVLFNEYDLKIKRINEIITFSLKLFNDYIGAVNVESNVPIPTTFLDNSYDNIFTFDEKITTAEFYKNYGNIVQFQLTTPSYNFKNIDGVDNSFRYLGKPGMKHYVEALEGNARSPKLEFYVMSQKEKEEFIKKDLEKEKLSNRDKENIDNTITGDLGLVETSDYKRSFIINAKKIDYPLLPPPEIETINENVLIRTNIHDLIYDYYEKDFYIAVATYEDVLVNNDIYKVKFNNNEEVIAITRLLHGLKKDKEYGIWIEDADCNQISNASTFIYNDKFNLDEDSLRSYELASIIDNIKTICKSTLPTNIYEDIISVLENNQTLTSYGIVTDILRIVFKNSLNKEVILSFLNKFKYFIGIMSEESNMLSNIKYNNGFLTFDSIHEGNLIIYSLDREDCLQFSNHLEVTNSINTTVYNMLLVIAINEDLKAKSNLIIVNNKEKYMEVL